MKRQGWESDGSSRLSLTLQILKENYFYLENMNRSIANSEDRLKDILRYTSVLKMVPANRGYNLREKLLSPLDCVKEDFGCQYF